MTPSDTRVRPHGLLLAAGAGTRLGRPKALLTHPDGSSYLEAAARALRDAGCPEVLVVLGAAADAAGERLSAARLSGVNALVCPTWAGGLGESLRYGLRRLSTDSAASLAVVHLVDLPDVGAGVIRQAIAEGATGSATLARASYGGVGGHPVLLGRDHWAGAAAAATGDQGARGYLGAHEVRLIEVGHRAGGRDVDTPADLARAGRAFGTPRGD